MRRIDVKKKLRAAGIIAFASVMVSACSFDTPSHVTTNKIQLLETSEYDTYATSNVSAFLLADIAAKQVSEGNGPMDVTVTFDPSSKVNTKAKAEREIARMVSALESQGVRDVRGTVLPVNAPPNYSVTTIRYARLTASGPKDCGKMPGYEDRATAGDTDIHKAYEYGCTVEDIFAQQVARPADLLGQDDFKTPGSGRYAGNVLENGGYYDGQRSQPLGGETSSDD